MAASENHIFLDCKDSSLTHWQDEYPREIHTHGLLQTAQVQHLQNIENSETVLQSTSHHENQYRQEYEAIGAILTLFDLYDKLSTLQSVMYS
jgi:hypothetical protein